MSHSKHTQPKKGFSLYIHKWNRNAKKYIKACIICGSEGYSPVILEPGFQDSKIHSINKAIYQELTKILKPIEIDDFGRCNDCAKIYNAIYNYSKNEDNDMKI